MEFAHHVRATHRVDWNRARCRQVRAVVLRDHPVIRHARGKNPSAAFAALVQLDHFLDPPCLTAVHTTRISAVMRRIMGDSKRRTC